MGATHRLPSNVRPIRLAPPPPEIAKASRAGYLAAAVIAAVALAVGLVWGLSAYRSVPDRVDGFARAEIPGEAVVVLPARTGRILYYEGPGSVSLAQLGVEVTDPSGASIAVRPYVTDLRYEAPDEVVGRAVGTFDAVAEGRYRIAANGDAPRSGILAVGGSVAGTSIGALVGALLVVLLGLGVAAGLAVLTSIRRSRP
ncbi:MAG: hypothetical protein ACE14W_08735 [Candidatus Velamenicoccus archaeovorus]